MTGRRTLGTITALILLGASLSPALQAAEPRYTYVEGGLLRVNPDGGSARNGAFLGGSFALAGFHFFGELFDVGSWEGIELGGGWHGLLGEAADLVARASYANADVEDGFRLSGGARWMVSPIVELNGFYHWSSFDELSSSSLELGGLWEFVPRLSLGVGYTLGNRNDVLRAYVRFSFKRNQ
jgi:hypothetical protein